MPLYDDVRVRVTADTDQAERGVRKVSQELDVMKSRATLGGVALAQMKLSAIGGLAAQAASGINALGAGLFGLTSALGPLTGLLGAVPGGLIGMASGFGAIKLAMGGVGDAFKALDQAEQRHKATALQVVDVQRQRVMEARAERNALEALADAQKNLNKALEPATYLDMREAELGLASARLAQSQATADLLKQNNLLAESQSKVTKVVQGIKDDFTGKTLEFVTEVKGEDLGDAMRRQESARIRAEESALAVMRAEERIVELKKKGSEQDESVIAARRQLRDATEALADLHYNMAHQQQQEAAAVVKEAQQLNDVMSKLSPAAIEFVNTIRSLKPRLEETKKAAQQLFFEGVNKGLAEALKNWDVFDTTMKTSAATLGYLVEQAGKLLGDEGFGNRFLAVVDSNDRAFRSAGEGIIAFADGMSYVAVAARPVVEYLGDLTKELGNQFREWAKAGQESGELTDFFHRTVDVTQDVIDIFGNLYAALRNLGTASREGIGDWMLNGLVEGTENWKEWTEKAENSQKVFEWFAGFKPVLQELGQFTKALAIEWVKLDGRDDLINTLQVLRTEALPIIVDFFEKTKALGPVMLDVLIQIAKAFTSISGSGSFLSTMLPVIDGLATALNFLLESVPGLDRLVAALLTMASIKKFSAMIGLTGLMTNLSTSVKDAYNSIGADAASGLQGAIAGTGKQAQTFGQQLRGLGSSLVNANTALAAGVIALQLWQNMVADAKQEAQNFGDDVRGTFEDPGAMGFDSFVRKQEELVRQHNHMVDESKGGLDFWNADYREAMANATHETGPLIEANNKLRDATEKLAAEAHISTDEAWKYVTAEAAAGREIDANTDLTNDYFKAKDKLAEDANRKLIDSTWGLIDAELASQGAMLDSKSAYERFVQDTIEGRMIPGTNEYERALLDLQRTMIADAQAVAANAEEQAKLEGKTLSTRDATQLQIDRLRELQLTVGKDSELGKRLQEHIDKLEASQGEFRATIWVDFKEGIRTGILKGLDLGGALGGALTLDLAKRAKGGPVQAGAPYVVGEDGPEIFQPNTSGYIHPNGAGPGNGSDLERVAEMVLSSMRPITQNNTFNTPADPNELAGSLMWEANR